MVFRDLSVQTGPGVPGWGEGANISGGRWGGGGANILQVVDRGEEGAGGGGAPLKLGREAVVD